MRVRTDIGALVTAGILAGVLTLVTVGDGAPPREVGPPAPASSQPATVDSQLDHVPDGVHPGVASGAPAKPEQALAVAGVSAKAAPPVSIDAYVLEALRGAVTYLALFLLCHLGLRKVRIGQRWAYAGIGAASGLLAQCTLLRPSDWGFEFQHGRLTEVLFVIALTGAIMGFLYRWRAGLDAEGDDPELLAQTLLARATAEGAPVAEGDPALVNTGQAEYFDGPLQVRTTAPVMFVAALVSSGFYGGARYLIGVVHDVSDYVHTSPGIGLNEAIGRSVNAELLTILVMGLVAPIPFAIIGFLSHLLARALNKTSYLAYVLAGLGAPILFSLVMGPMGLFYGLQAALPMALALALYRNMAGLEPKAVKEDIIVRDRRNLVGENHARRQFGRLVKS